MVYIDERGKTMNTKNEKNLKQYMGVGELAKRLKVTVRTLQYYDKIGLLCPSAESEGGRRLYSDKDMVKLHQILSLKYLGFTLDDIKNRVSKLENPSEIQFMLEEQATVVKQKIEEFSEALSTIEKLKEEIVQMKTVDFKKIADIMMLLKSKNECYWAIKYFDERLMSHVTHHFDGNSSSIIIEQWKMLCDDAVKLERLGNSPESDEGQHNGGKCFWNSLKEI